MLMSINVVILNCCCSYFVVIVGIMLILANGFVEKCNNTEKGDEKASLRKYVYNTFAILGMQTHITSRFHNAVCICLTYFVNKDIDINSDIYDNIL